MDLRTKKWLIFALVVILTVLLMPLQVFAAATGTHKPIEGVTVDVSGATDNSMSSGAVTVTAKGSSGFMGLGASSKTATITVSNSGTKTATVSFDWTATSVNELKIDGTVYSGTSGSFSRVVAAGAKFTITITTAKNTTTNKLVMNNFGWAEAAESSNVTFQYNSSLGSVKVGEATVDAGGTVSVSSEGTEVVATPASGAAFLGWVDEEGRILSTNTSYTVTPAEDMIVRAVFVGANSEPWFGVGTVTQHSENLGLLGFGGKLNYQTVAPVYLFNSLSDANYFADNDANNKAIVLMNSGTLPAGDYTIPAGVTLLIPFDSSNTLYTTQAQSTDTYTKPTAYRTLTLADGVNLTVNGSLSLSAKHRYAQGSEYRTYGGAPTAAVSFIQMQGDSTITVNNGGALYAYGFITGSGSVDAKNGSSIYEMFQFTDFRGGDQTSSMSNGKNANGVFPLSQYYVQNIEVPLTLYSGAKEYAHTSAYMNGGTYHSTVEFIGPTAGMFNIVSGYCVKYYDGATDRLMVEAYGDVKLSQISITIATVTIKSAEYELPINSNITVLAKTGSSLMVNQDIAMLPGSELIIESGASCTLGNGISVYTYDADNWGGYCGPGNLKFDDVYFAPGRTYTRTAADLVDAFIQVDGTLDASAGYLYTTAGGANIFSTGTGVVKINPGTQTVTHQLVQATGYTEIPIIPAQLKNAGGSYVDTSKTAGTYTYTAGVWKKTECTHAYTETITAAAGCETEGIKTFACKDTANCGHSYPNPIPATGHNFSDWVSTDTEHWHKCSACGTANTDVENHYFVDGTCLCGHKGRFSIAFASMTMANSLDMNFAFPKGHMTDWDGCYAVITKEYADGRDDVTQTILFADWNSTTIDGVEHYYVTFTGIAAKEMTDEIRVVIYDANNNAISTEWLDSVQKQAMRNLEKPNVTKASQRMVVDMLNYGTSAQIKFGYNTDNLADSQLTDEQKTFATESATYTTNGTPVIPETGYMANVKLVSNIQFMMAFKVEEATRYEVSYMDHYGNSVCYEVSIEEITLDNGFFVLTIDKTVVADGHQPITCTIYNGETVVMTVIDSIAAYALRAKDTSSNADLYEMMMRFCDSAYAYFQPETT